MALCKHAQLPTAALFRQATAETVQAALTPLLPVPPSPSMAACTLSKSLKVLLPLAGVGCISTIVCWLSCGRREKGEGRG